MTPRMEICPEHMLKAQWRSSEAASGQSSKEKQVITFRRSPGRQVHAEVRKYSRQMD